MKGKTKKFTKLSFLGTFRFMASSRKILAKGIKREDYKNNNHFNEDNSIFGNILNRQNEDENKIFKIL